MILVNNEYFDNQVVLMTTFYFTLLPLPFFWWMWYNDVKIGKRGGVMTVFLVIAGIVVFLIAFAAIFGDNKSLEKSYKNKLAIQNIQSSNEFTPTKSYISKNNKSGIEINENDKLIRIFYLDQNEEIKSKIYHFSDLIESEVKIDNQSVLKTSRSSQLVGAAVGTVVAGGIGAIIGGLSGSKTQNEYIKNIDLCVKVNDFNTPLFKISFLSNISEFGIENKQGLKKDHKDVQEALRDVEYWHSILNLIIKNNA
ncbi:putative immunity protein [Geobacillus virus E3]|uniref:putative immunity protein n=1 Tax=Geobacillus virus E3 TaxID=1572712 RepID=UPI000671A79E|nr:putative immunity protein [Geobacillus virus E3]AJA41360.1 putative immunity protein [Geobacillus virus E3]